MISEQYFPTNLPELVKLTRALKSDAHLFLKDTICKENIEDNLEIALKQAEVDKIQLEIMRNELEQQELIDAADDRHQRLVQSMMNQVQHLDQNFVLDILKLLGLVFTQELKL